MEFTGERFIPGDENELHLGYEHRHRYESIAEIVKGKYVLDIASGEGYGSAIIARTAAKVLGIDIDAGSVNAASAKYSETANLSFQCGSVTAIDLLDEVVDVIVSFETLEHIAEHAAMLSEFRRVLKKDGLLVISTPDKRTYTDEPGYVNKFHVKELYKNEFYDLLKLYFHNVELFGQRFLTLSSILRADSSDPQEQQKTIIGNLSEKDSVYLVAICSNVDSATANTIESLYFDPKIDLYAIDKSALRWASSVDDELSRTQKDYFNLETELLAVKEELKQISAELTRTQNDYFNLEAELFALKGLNKNNNK